MSLWRGSNGEAEKYFMLDRRSFLTRIGAACAAVPLGCSRSNKQETLRVFVYSGNHEQAMHEAFVPGFEKMTGAKVILDGGWWDSIGKLKASPKGDPAFDLVITDATQGYPAIMEGMFRKLDMNRIPNREKISPSALDNWVYKEGYGLPFPDSVMTLAYHRELVDTAPTSWADLLKTSFRQKIGLYESFYMSLYTFACIKAAEDGRAGHAAEEVRDHLDDVLRYAREHRDIVKFWWKTSTEMGIDLANRSCAIGNMHSPEMLKLLEQKKELGAVVPPKDRAFVQVMWLIPEDTPRYELAQQAIDFIFSDDVQRRLTQYGSATPVLSIAQERAAADLVWKMLYPHTEEQMRTISYYPYDVYARDWDQIAEYWDRKVLRNG